jgi:signal transduction histidine kinase
VAALNISTFDIYGQILAIGVPTIIVALIVLVFALRWVTGVALRPLNDMTSLAMKITDGSFGERLEVEDPNTELGKTAVAFDKMLDALETSLHRARLAEERLRQLCADVAHELRSPVSSMVAAADNLMREVSLGKPTAAATRTLAEETAMAVVRDGRRAGRIVGDLTLAAQLDVAELAEREVMKQRVDVSRLLEGAVDSFAIGSDYVVSLEDKAGETWVQADPERIQQILTNLLSNASRWTENSIALKTSRSGKNWMVTVTDDGPGVPAEYRETIFGRFVRLDTARDRSRGGSGLGLAISRALAEAHGGKLVCLENASPSGGAVFRLTLPISA